MQIKIPELCLVMLVGATSSGKSSFAKKHFLPTEVLSSDYFRALISDDESSQEVTNEAFETLHYVLEKRLKNGKLTVVDATNVQAFARKQLRDLATKHHVFVETIVFDLPEKLLVERHKQRTDRNFGDFVIRNHSRELKRFVKHYENEGFKKIYVLRSEEEVNTTEIIRNKLWNNRKETTGPFDIIGDVHGCFTELCELMRKLGYSIDIQADKKINIRNPEGRTAIFVGDLTDRGDNSPDVLRLVMTMIENKQAFCVCGNHDAKLLRHLKGNKVKLAHGLDLTVEQLAAETEEFRNQVRDFLDKLISHYVFDEGKLVVAHAGIREDMQGRTSGAVKSFCLYGDTTGEIDEFGLPVRLNWAAEYKGKAMVVYGHTPVPFAEWLNNTIDIDTGCVFGGKLTALRYPERELVEVKAKKVYAEPKRPLHIAPYQSENAISAQQEIDDVLDFADFSGKKFLETRYNLNVSIREHNMTAALEVMSRFALNPKWLIYLPPTMSPCETSSLPDYLEYPTEAFSYFKKNGVEKVICEEKHMGSRAVVVICKSVEAAKKHFGVIDARIGVCYTRTGRNFFNDKNVETEFLQRIQSALTQSETWERFQTEWICLDCELMPWSAKAQELIRVQYAAVGASATQALAETLPFLRQTQARGIEIGELLTEFEQKQQAIAQYVTAFRQYCKETNGLEGWKLAPFHILATEGKTHTDKDHIWQMETIAHICKFDKELLMATPYRVISLENEQETAAAEQWWLDLTANGGEGMVVKPLHFISRKKDSLIQPAIKVRGREYLRIIYGAEYAIPKNITRLKERAISAKRSLALREFVLGLEALDRFAEKRPLRQIHECIMGILALETEGIDPRL